MNLKEQRSHALKAAQDIVDNAKDAGRTLTKGEREAVDGHLAQIKDIDAMLTQKAKDDDRMKAVGALFGSSEDPHTPDGGRGVKAAEGRAYLDLQSIERASVKAAARFRNAPAGGVKALMAEGESLVEVARVFDQPVSLNAPVSNVFDLVPTRLVPASFSYLRQTTRDNKAAVVARGAVKPTSAYGLERVENTLKVIAHLSDPMAVFDLLDYQSLSDFIANEMRYGIYTAVESQFFNGAGDATSLHGLATTSGIQVQQFNKDLVLTLRSAITKLEANGHRPSGVMMHPLDYEALETSTYTLNADNVNTPIDRMARRVWGVPVALSTALPQGTSYLVSTGSVELNLNEAGTALSWGCIEDDFARNQVRARLEGRFEVSVLRPQGIVKATLTAA